MNMKPFTQKFYLAALSWLLVFGLSFSVQQLNAQAFGCSQLGYLIQNNRAYSINLSTGSYTELSSGNGFGFEGGPGLNGVGYNPTDGMFWGHYLNKQNIIGRLNANMELDTFRISGLPIVNKNYYIGDVDLNGIMYLSRRGGQIHKIDVNPSSPTYLTYLGSIASVDRNYHDIAFNPVDGKLYSVIKGNNDLIRIDPTTGALENFGTIHVMSSENTPLGAVYFGNDGSLYVSANASGVIYKISTVHLLTVGDVIDATPFAFGPSSSSNDGCRCPTAEVVQEVCDNGFDDDGDVLIDCDDPACYYNTHCFEVSCSNFIDDDQDGFMDCEDTDCYNHITCTAAGAGGGGFESNGDLAQKIGQRDFRRVRFPGVDLDDKTQLPLMEKTDAYANNISFRGPNNLTDFIPVDAIEGTDTYIATPEDIIGLTNATEAIGVDVYRGPGRVGAVLATTSEEKVYEHTKPICDRVKGNVLLDVYTEKLDGGNDFIIAKYGTLTGGTDYSCTFSGRLKSNGLFDVENHWNIKDYPQEGTYYNFQVWATSLNRLQTLVNEILFLMEVQVGIETYNISAPPQLYVKEQEYGNGFVKLHVVNKTGVREINFVGTNSRSETEDLKNFEWTVDLSGEVEEIIEIPTEGIYNIGGDLTFDNGQNFDAIYAADGVWGLSFQSSGAEKKSFDIMPVEPQDDFNGRLIERNVRLNANVTDYITIYRAISPAFQSYDLREFNTLAFEAEGVRNLEVKIIKESIENWDDQPTINIQVDGRCKEVYINIDDFDTTGEDDDWSDVQMLAFTYNNEGEASTEINLNISNVAFQSLSQYPECEKFNVEELTVFPNPMRNEVNFLFPSSENFTYDLMISNQFGQVIAEQNGQQANGRYISFRNEELPSGIYFYYIRLENGPYYSGKILVVK